MSTRASEKLRLALAAIAAVAAVYAVTTGSLMRLAVWAERDADAYPYFDEDWLRYLLPHMFERLEDGPGPHVLVTGPSAVREDVLVAPLEAAIAPGRVFQGGISLGTVEDVVLSLEYIEGAYGADALPDVLLLGLTPRFVANVPADRPLQPAIDLYSPWFHVVEGPDGPTLARKGPIAGLRAWLRFRLTKQTPRYRTALVALAGRYVQAARSRCADATICPFGWPLDVAERVLSIPRAVSFLGLRPVASVGIDRFIRIVTSPIKYKFTPPHGDEWLRRILSGPDTFWRLVFAWDPREDEPRALRRLERLREFLDRHDIELVAVNLPENDIVGTYFLPERYAAYRSLVERALTGARYVDLRDFLRRDEFLDAVHATPPGAVRFTEEIATLLISEPDPDRMGGGEEHR